MKKCISKRALEDMGDKFDEYCDGMQKRVKATPVEKVLKDLPTMVQEDGDWKIAKEPF